MFYACGDDDGFPLVASARRYDFFRPAEVFYTGHLLRLNVCAVGYDLIYKLLRKLVSAYLRGAGKVFNLRGIRHLTAEIGFFKYERGFAGSQSVEGGGKSRRPCADYYNIMHFIKAILYIF